MKTIFSIGLIASSLFALHVQAADTNGDGREVILVPFDVAPSSARSGLQGSSWSGELYFRNGSPSSINLVELWGCPVTCSLTFPGDYTGVVPGPHHPSTEMDRGILFSVPASVAAQVTFAGRFYETTRGAQPLGVAIPIVREGNFLHGTTYLLNVPAGGRVRTSIRIYDPRREFGRTGQVTLLIEILRLDGTPIVARTITTVAPVNEAAPVSPGFAVIYDLGAAFPEIQNLSAVHIRLTATDPNTDYWAMASATDNETQEVVLITPG